MNAAGIEALRAKVLDAIEAFRPRAAALSAAIHGRPELGGKEEFASALLIEALRAAGFEVEPGFAGMPTAFRARSGARSGGSRGPGGPRIAFLAEYDALPDIGHACGHNLICTASLTAGIGLAAAAREAGGEVLVFGTPAEETEGAKIAMAAAGRFADIDAALMIHPYAGDYFMTESLALDPIEIEFEGRSAHAAAAPWEGLNALDAVILTFNAVNALRQQMRPDARVHGVITNGGSAPNVVPERAAARFYVRARDRAYLDGLSERFRDCARAAALATGTRVAFKAYEGSFDDMVNNLTLASRMREHMERDLGSPVFGRAPESFGSIDMGNVSRVVPAIHVLVDIAQGVPMGLHTREFRDAAASPYAFAQAMRAAKGLALTGLDALCDPEFLAAAKAEFIDSMSEG